MVTPWLSRLITACATVLFCATPALAQPARTQAATSTGTAPGVSAEEILIGQSAPLSGPAAELGAHFNIGAKAYIDHINRQGGIHGRKIRIITEDDFNDPAQAASNTRRLLNQHRVLALFGYVGSPATLAALPEVNSQGVPFIAPSAGDRVLQGEARALVFNIRASYRAELESLVRHQTTLGMKRFAVFHEDTPFGNSALADFDALASSSTLEISARVAGRDPGAAQQIASRLLQGNPDTIVMLCTYRACANVIRATRKAGYAGQFLHLSTVGTQPLINELGKGAAGAVVAQVVPAPWGAGLPIVREYQTVLSARGISEFNHSTLEGYLAARVLVSALRRAGSTPSRETLLQSLENTTEDFGGYIVRFAPGQRSGSSFTELTVIGSNGTLLR